MIATSGKPTEDVLGRDGVEGGGDGDEQVWMVSSLGFSKACLHIAPQNLARIEVGRVAGQESGFRAGLFDQGKGALVFVGSEIVYYHNVARSKRGDEYLADIGLKDLGVRGALDGHARVVPSSRTEEIIVVVRQ